MFNTPPPEPPQSLYEIYYDSYKDENEFDDVRLFADAHDLRLTISVDEHSNLVYHLSRKYDDVLVNPSK